MGFFGFSTKKEVEEKERLAREAEKQRVLQGQQADLSNIAKGSQVKFAVPFLTCLILATITSLCP